MRLTIIALSISALIACDSGPDFTAVQEQDTIEAYEQFLANDPSSIYKPQIDVRLEELYFAKAKADGSVTAWDAYFAKYPEGKHAKDAQGLKEDAGFADAQKENSADAYRKFLADYPKASQKHASQAQGMVAVSDYGKLTVAEPVIAQVNLAEDPKGPMNGWGVSAAITNGGDKTFKYVNVTVDLLGDDGAVLDRKTWPLTSTSWTVPATDEQKAPFAPGQTRTWSWSAALDGVPADWHQKAKVYVTDVRE